MISNVTTLIRSAFSTFGASNATVSNPYASEARRVGPNRVIMVARLNGMTGGMRLSEIRLVTAFGSFSAGKSDEESVLVSVEKSETQAGTVPPFEKRATLKVKVDTKFLSVSFIDDAGGIYKSERLRIK